MPNALKQGAQPDVTSEVAPVRGGLTPADLDRMLHDWQSRFTGGRSPSTVSLALLDWAAHAANAPFQTATLARTAMAQWGRLAATMIGGEDAIAPQPDDHRFASPAWKQRPYNWLIQAVLLGEEWSDQAVRNPSGVAKPNERIVAFTVRQWLDLVSPSNVPWLNPEVIEATRASGGANLAAGLAISCATGRPPAASRPKAGSRSGQPGLHPREDRVPQ